MPRVTIVQVIYNSRRYIEPVFSAIFNQTCKDFNVVAVISGNNDGSKELLGEKFPQVENIDPGYNIGFAKGHNLVFEKYGSEFFQLVNPDLILEPTYVENILKAFDDPKVGAATGKLLQYDFTMGTIVHNGSHCVIDSTGVTVSKSGRARDRGQHEVDRHQYDALTSVDAVSGAACMYRRSALESVKLPHYDTVVYHSVSTGASSNQSEGEYFDEDFHSYWEDVDLAWRMTNAGWRCAYEPSAAAYHGRAAGSSKNGYADVAGFIKHHKKISPEIRRLNYRNHIFMYVKNSPWFYPQFFIRELAMLAYIVLFETGTLKAVPEMVRLLPKMWEKRRYIQRAKQ